MIAMRPVVCALLLAGVLSAASGADLPLTRVVLFSSGVGYFERLGEVEGNAGLQLSFRVEQINDILKSLVLQDLGGGSVAPVTYAPLDPLEKTLSSFAVDISDNPNVAELWDRLRGAKVEVTADKPVAGVVFGAEKQQKSVEDQILTFDVLNLLTDEGLVEVPLWQARRIRILDENIDADLRKALSAIDSARDTGKRPVNLTFNGEGKREVVVGYLLETPVWKTSYRLISDEEGLFLQGWSIVENTTDEDWDRVSLGLVSGRPVSFIQDLYPPLYVRRPVVAPSVAAAAAPRIWEGDMGVPEPQMEAAPAATARRGRNGGEKGDKGDRGEADTVTADEMAGFGGMGVAQAPAAAALGRTTAAMAAGGKVGTLFEYAINQPVSVPRQQSAMIPIISSAIEGEKLSIFNAAVDSKYPMNAIQLRNTTGLHLMGGAITVFDGGVYAGDALVEDVVPGDERLVSYAVDLGTEVDVREKSEPERLVATKVVAGVMTVRQKMRQATTYVVKNSAAEPKTVVIEHPANDDWTLVEPNQADERTRSHYRFKLAIDPDKTVEMKVVLERVLSEEVELTDLDKDDLVEFLAMDAQASDAIRAAVQSLLGLRTELAALVAQREEKETQIEEIGQEQERIRQNMKELDRQSDLYRKYVDKLTVQENELDKLREEVKTLRGQEQDKERAIATYIAELSVE